MGRKLLFLISLFAFAVCTATAGTIKVYLLAGQSNMLERHYYTDLPAALQNQAMSNVSLYVGGDYSHTNVPLIYGANYGNVLFGPEAMFAYEMSAANPGQKIALIKTARGGTGLFDRWRPPSSGGTLGDVWTEFVNNTNNALNTIRQQNPSDVVVISGMLWMQGEQDAQNQSPANDYQTNLTNFIKDVRTQFSVPAMPFAISMIDQSPAWPYNSIVRSAETTVSQSVANVLIFDTHGFQTDLVHYKPLGFLQMGYEYSRAFLGTRNKVEFNFTYWQEGWNLNNAVTYTQNNGTLDVNINNSAGDDPYIQTDPFLNFNPALYKSVNIRMQNATSDKVARFAWYKSDGSLGDIKSFNINANDKNFTDYYVDLNGTSWSGDIKSLKLSFVNNGQAGKITIDYIKLLTQSSTTQTAPVLTVPADMIVSTATGLCSAVVNYSVGLVSDDPNTQVTYSSPSGSTFQKGITTVTVTALNSAGLGDTKTFKVTVNDNEAPIPNLATLPDIISSSSVTVSTRPTAKDNCAGQLTATTSNPLAYSTPGTYTITWTYNDGNGNSTAQIQKVIIGDNVPPVPDLTVLPDVTGSCSAAVSTAPTATDNLVGKVTGTTSDPLAYTKPGTYTITWTYNDGSGNLATQTQRVIVIDNVAPVPDIPFLPDLSGTSPSTTFTIYPTATDNCKGKIYATTSDPLSYSKPGIYTINWNYNDGNGNASTQKQKVLIVDSVAPVPDASTLPDVVGNCTATVTTSPTATDNFAGKVTATTSNVLTYSKKGTYTISWVFNDGNGNTSTQTQRVIVNDNLAPVPDVASLPDITGVSSGTVTSPPTATDNCAGKVTASTTDPLTYSKAGTYTINWSYNDGNGNISSQTQKVVVTVNTTPPVPDVTALPDITGNCSVTLSSYPTATANNGQKITGATSNPLTYSKPGTYTVTWTYTDGTGNVTTQSQKVIVVDNAAPVPNLATLADITGTCSVTVSTYPKATDNCAGTITAATSNPLVYSKSGTYLITWLYNDGNGNTSTQTQKVVVVDNAAPVPDLAVLPDLSGICSITITTYPTAADNCAGKVTATTGNPLTYSKPGTYTITWNYSDGNGNTATQTQKVVVTDNIAPVPDVATLPDITGSCSVTVTSYPTATDNCTGKITATTTSATSYNKAGSYTITWTYNDGNGNSATQIQKVIVVDATAPAPDIATLPDINSTTALTVSVAPTATDNCTGKVTATTSNTLNFTQPGSYSITWTYNDGNGNSTAQTQKVIVADKLAPVPDVATLSDISAGCSITISNYPTATDNFAGKITATTTSPLTYSKPGTYTITWSYNDGNGNMTTQTQKIIITDTQAPVPDIASLPAISGTCSVAVSTYPTATDNCAGKVIATTSSYLTYSKAGTYTITWNYSDGNGNTSSQTQTIVVIDNTPPVPDIATLPDIIGGSSTTITTIPTATDMCTGKITATTQNPLAYSKAGTYTIIWNYSDGNGNTSSQTQRVIINSNAAPIPDLAVLPDLTAVCSLTITTFPTATDNQSRKITATTTSPLTYPKSGTYIITWNYTDAGGNTALQTQKVTLSDLVAPVPDLTTLPSINGSCNATITTYPTATDNCSGKVTATTSDPLTYTKPGTYTINWIYSDGNGNSAAQTQKVILTDNTPPIPSVSTLPDITGISSATVTTVPTATDNCASKVIVSTKDSLTYKKPGTYIVTWIYDDGNGNTSSQTQRVIVIDNQAPVPDVANLPEVTGSCTATVSGYPTATDNFAGKVTATTASPLTYTTPGTYTITWFYNDGFGNTATQTQKVTVTDVVAPVPSIAALPDIAANCAVNITSYPTATDNCAGLITGTTTSALTYTKPGTYTITWTYKDANNNSATQIQKVIVTDNIAPVPDVTSLPDIVGTAATTVTAVPTATDNCVGKVNATTSNTLTYSKPGTYTITWNYSDGNGNSTTQTQKVVLTDNLAPVPDVSVLPTITGDCSVTVGTTPTATDNFAGKVTASTSNPTTYTKPGTYTITWTYNDGNGNSVSQIQKVTVGDNLPPVPDLGSLPEVTASASATVTTVPTATDVCAGKINATTSDPLTYNKAGTYTITWTFSDGNGNSTTQLQKVIIGGSGSSTPNLTIDDITRNEGNGGTTIFTFTVKLSAATSSAVTFTIATSDGTGTAADNDYVARAASTQTIAAGSTSFPFAVTVNGDTKLESNETFFVNITNVSGATLADGQGQGTIVNDDPLPELTVTDVKQLEGNSGTSTFNFTVKLSAPAGPAGVTFNIATANGTATAGSDYVSKSLSSQTIAAGIMTYSFPVTVSGDVTVEPNETFFVNITNVTGASETGIQGIGYISNDDGNCPTLPDYTPPTVVTKDITVILDASGHATVKPTDVIQTVTDACGVDNTSYTITPSTFDCSSVTAFSNIPDHVAYSTTATAGNQVWGGELGLEFTVNNASGITITQLGAFDHQGDGIKGSISGGIRVAIFNKANQTIVPGLDVIITGSGDTYTGNHRMKNITPVTLMPGNYVVVSKGYNSNEMNFNAGLNGNVALSTMDNASGAVTFAGTGLYGNQDPNTFAYPGSPDAGPANRYLAGNFSYKVAIISTPVTNSHQAYTTTIVNGNQLWTGELGMEFKVNNAAGINVTQLGAFDHQGDGIKGSISGGIRVAIFNKTTKTIVPGLDAIISGNADSYTGNHRIKNITPVTLLPGEYTIVAKGYNSNEFNGNANDNVTKGTTDDGSGAVTFTGGGLWGNDGGAFTYPANPDAGPANRYLAGTFIYEVRSSGFEEAPSDNNSIAAHSLSGTSVIVGGDPLANLNGDKIAGAVATPNSVANAASITVTVTAKDNNGNTGQSTASVTVIDNSAPIIIPKNITVQSDSKGHVSILPTDVIQTVIDNCGVNNSSITVSQSSFDCQNASVTHQAYTAITNIGNQAWGGELGLEFKVNIAAGITISQLGAFDHQGNGITGTQNGGVRVAIYNKSTKTIVPGLDVTISGNADSYTGNYRMKNITPVTLLPGEYTIVAKGYNNNELNGNVLDYIVRSTMDDGSGAVTFTGGGLWGNDAGSFVYPPNPDGGPVNRYLAGTFVYKRAGNSSGGQLINTVTITATDLYGNKGTATATVSLVCNQSLSSIGMEAAPTARVMEVLPLAAGTAEEVQGKVKIFPNPSNGEFSMVVSGNKSPRMLFQLTNINGRVIEQKLVETDGKSASLTVRFNVSNQPQGMYLIKLIGSDESKIYKVMVVR